MEKHKHNVLIKRWADGDKIQFKNNGIWEDIDNPTWMPYQEYRIIDKYTHIREAALNGKKIYHKEHGSLKWFESQLTSKGIITNDRVNYYTFNPLCKYCTESELETYTHYESLEDLKNILGRTVKCFDGVGVIVGGFVGNDYDGNPRLYVYTGDAKESIDAITFLNIYKFEDGEPCGKKKW